MKKNIPYLLVLACFLILGDIHSQDVHSSHIHATPTFISPALNGLFNGDVRFMASTRSQWNSVTKGYKTASGAIDLKVLTMGNGDLVGAGVNVFADKAGDLDYKSTGVGLGLSYLKSLNGRRGGNYVSFGFQIAQLSNGLDYSKIVAFDAEPLVLQGATDKVNYLDFSTGVAWFYEINKTTNMHLGVSAMHLNKPQVSYIDDENLTDDQLLFRKLTFHGAVDFKLTRKSNLKPSFIFADQGPHREITAGTFYKYRTKADRIQKETSSIYLGAWLRWYAEKDIRGVDALVAAVRFDYKNTHMTFTFDVNISSLKEASGGSGGPEFSIVQILDFEERRKPFKVRCPAFTY